LSTNEFERRIPVVIPGPAVFPVMIMVRDEVGINTVVLKELGKRMIKRLERAPAAVKEVIAPGV
jgi:hypothetical protein